MVPANFKLSIRELEIEQRASAGRNLGRLISDCIYRYLNASELLQLDEPIFQEMRSFLGSGFSTLPLDPLYRVICERYNNEVYCSQMEMWVKPELDALTRWSQYYHGQCVPRFVSQDDWARNILCVMRLIPCLSPDQALESLIYKASDMTMPNQSPPWISDGAPEFFYKNDDSVWY